MPYDAAMLTGINKLITFSTSKEYIDYTLNNGFIVEHHMLFCQNQINDFTVAWACKHNKQHSLLESVKMANHHNRVYVRDQDVNSDEDNDVYPAQQDGTEHIQVLSKEDMHERLLYFPQDLQGTFAHHVVFYNDQQEKFLSERRHLKYGNCPYCYKILPRGWMCEDCQERAKLIYFVPNPMMLPKSEECGLGIKRNPADVAMLHQVFHEDKEDIPIDAAEWASKITTHQIGHTHCVQPILRIAS